MDNTTPKKSIGIFSLTSCEGCQFAMLNHYVEFNKLQNYFEVKNFRLGQEENMLEDIDVAIIEGSVENKEQIDLVRKIRSKAKYIVIVGACAHLGGIQSERNSLPKPVFQDKGSVRRISDVTRVDYIIPGCPINHHELYECLMDIYWGKDFVLYDKSVCFECRKNENQCLLREGKVCLGPVTRGGCDSICRNKGEACLGCRGTIPGANISKLKQLLGTIVSEDEVEKLLNIYGELK